MLVFISWSGQRSKVVAEALETWLAQVIQAVEPWISQDIDKGLRWGAEIADRLERSKVGIICLTKSNLDAKWIHFEAGALSKTKDAYVCTLLLDIKPSDVEQPLAQFQHTATEKDDIFQLLSTINRAVQKSGEKALAEPVLRGIFETYWPRLKETFQKITALQESSTSQTRPDSEVLQEILEIVRNQERKQNVNRSSDELILSKDQRVAVEVSLLRSDLKNIRGKIDTALTSQDYLDILKLIKVQQDSLYGLVNFVSRYQGLTSSTHVVLRDIAEQLEAMENECRKLQELDEAFKDQI